MDIHGPLQTRGETRCPGGVSVSCLASRTRHECPRHNESVYGGLTLNVDRHYIGSVTATTHQEKGIITLESNPSRGTVLPSMYNFIARSDNIYCTVLNVLLIIQPRHSDPYMLLMLRIAGNKKITSSCACVLANYLSIKY